MAVLSTDKSVPKHVERLFRGLPAAAINTTPLLSLAAVPVLGIFLISFSCDLAALTAAITVQTQEFTITAAGDEVGVEVGDIFIPACPPVGTGAGLLDATVSLSSSTAITKHKIPVNAVNLTAAATNPGLSTLKYLWVKTVATSGT